MDVVACDCSLFARGRDDKSEIMLVERVSLLQSASVSIDTKETVTWTECTTISMSDPCLIDEMLTQITDGLEYLLV
jgi:hypothetical protein